MKIKFKYAALAVVALTMGLTSCSNNNEFSGEYKIVAGDPTAMELAITAPRALQGRAADDGNATDAEVEMNDVNVLIYAETSIDGFYILEQNVALKRNDFKVDREYPDTYMMDGSKITTTTGNKRIYILMNYPGVFPELNSPLSDLAKVVYTLTATNSLSSNGLAMASTEAKQAKLVVETTPGTTPAANVVTVSVKRMVAKVTVQEDITRDGAGKITTLGGVFTNLQFALGNINKKTYAIQNRVGTTPNIVVHDTNWENYVAGDFFTISSYLPNSTEYFAVDANTATALTAKAVYVPENTTKTYNVNGDNLTYVSVRAQYAPAYFCNASGASKGANTAVKSFWTVVKADGSIYFFDVEADATTFSTANAGSTKSTEYKSGLCYYRAYLNKTGAPDAHIPGSVAAKFDVLRNNYYKVTINSIKAPGKPVDEAEVTEDTSLIVNVEVETWSNVADGYDLL
ncbi:Mfa1 family fimbria major subunit [Bacteroides sp. 519]|uniref:Mfa1 family fimbria major subunit n=1 Tax=Bacteroides sp. 519 TaxID=2302937 RepID=UPI0013CFD7C0|nr:Mfa1 family fimbria major subunit [Bacteroides sp. 519]NDV58281.1 hypothetical protein [Bacteroides sp. 519]